MKYINIFNSNNLKSPLIVDFQSINSFNKNLNNYDNIFFDLDNIIKFSILNGSQPSPISNIVDYLIRNKDTIEFKIKINQLYDSFFDLIFTLFSIDHVNCCKDLLLSATSSSDFGIKVSAKFYLDIIQVFEKNISLDHSLIDNFNKLIFGQLAYSYINNIFIRIPNRMIYLMRPNTRILFIKILLNNRPRFGDLMFIKKYYKQLLPSLIQRALLLFIISDNSKRCLLISIFPNFFLYFTSILMTGLFILRHPYILKAISIWSFGFSNLLFIFIRVFYFFKLNISKSDINITRAMGGIGDMVMLRVAIKLHLKLFKNNIYLYIPEKYFPVFHDIPQIRLLNINNKSKSFFSTNYNFTDCPAGHIEGAQYPNIKINRIEAFIYAMNLFLPSSKDQYHLLSFNPSFYPVSNINCINHEGDIFNLQKLKIESNKKVLFYQPYSADSYKNYYNDDLLYKLNLRYIVILIGIDNEIFSNSQLKNTFLLNENLQGFISAVQLSDICLGVDSSLIHIARGFGKPIVTLFGPTDGNLLMKNYPNFKLVQKYSIYFCSPCWRNESIKCRWNNTFVSDCMIVDSEHVLDAVLNLTN